MALIKLTFDGANNTAKMDADINSFLTSFENGIINGIGDSLNYSISNGRITFGSGVVCVYGRRVYVEAGTYIDIPLDSTKYGYVVMNINTETNDVSMSTVESTSKDISLTKTPLSSRDGLYQFVMCAYYKTPTSLNINSDFSRSYIKTFDSKLSDLKTAIETEFKYRFIRRYSKVNGEQKFDISNYDISSALIIVPINYRVMIPIPATLLSTKGSIKTIEYAYAGTKYSLICEKGTDGYLHLTPGNVNHDINVIYIYN